jgi:hypothetical protein
MTKGLFHRHEPLKDQHPDMASNDYCLCRCALALNTRDGGILDLHKVPIGSQPQSL